MQGRLRIKNKQEKRSEKKTLEEKKKNKDEFENKIHVATFVNTNVARVILFKGEKRGVRGLLFLRRRSFGVAFTRVGY